VGVISYCDNGLMVDFFDAEAVAATVAKALPVSAP
jgi:hypothetical protein